MKKIMVMAALGVLLFSSPSFAECNALCRQKCQSTAARAGNTVGECIQKWSYINSKYGARASQFSRNQNWNRGLCEMLCKLKWRKTGHASAEACIVATPCSKFPN